VVDPVRERAFSPMPRTWRQAAVVGGAVAVLLFAYVVFIGRAELTAAPTGNFYDLQARAWFDGHWDIHPYTDDAGRPLIDGLGNPQTPLSIEAIMIDGRAYLYYGPVPSLLRVPVLAVTDSFDGELTQFSMLGAFVVALGGLAALHWRIRCLVRGRARAVSRREVVLAGATVFALGAGTALLYLGSQPVVYHEATLWGVAFALAAYAAIIDAIVRPSARSVGWAGAWTTLALLTRVSVGFGPLVVLGLLLVVQLWRLFRPSRTGGSGAGVSPAEVPPERTGGSSGGESGALLSPERPVWPQRAREALIVACLVPVGLYAMVNVAKFGEFFRLPLEKQVFSQIDPQRQGALDANGGSLFSASYLPSTIWQYSRPDALELDALAPWINFPREQATVIGDAVFDTRDESSSVPATMPLFTVLTVIGLIALVRDLVRREHRLQPLLVPVVGAAAGTIGVLTIGFIANRYLGDFLPLLVLLGLLGLEVFVDWWARDRRLFPLIAFGVLAAWGVAANVALAVEYQRLIAPVDPRTRDAFVAWQYGLPHAQVWGRIGVGPPPTGGDPGERGDIVLGIPGLEAPSGGRVDDRARPPFGTDCTVYWSDGFGWYELSSLDCNHFVDDLAPKARNPV
jgi:hypothetical protein